MAPFYTYSSISVPESASKARFHAIFGYNNFEHCFLAMDAIYLNYPGPAKSSWSRDREEIKSSTSLKYLELPDSYHARLEVSAKAPFMHHKCLIGEFEWHFVFCEMSGFSSLNLPKQYALNLMCVEPEPRYDPRHPPSPELVRIISEIFVTTTCTYARGGDSSIGIGYKFLLKDFPADYCLPLKQFAYSWGIYENSNLDLTAPEVSELQYIGQVTPTHWMVQYSYGSDVSSVIKLPDSSALIEEFGQ